MWRGESQLGLKQPETQTGNVFIQGILVSVLNPKVALFFLSFLPQFVDLAAPSTSLQILILGILFSVLATVCNLAYAVAGSWLFNQPNTTRYSRALEGASGMLLLGLAGKVIASEK